MTSSLTIPNLDFVTLTTISSSQMNANFNAVQSWANANFPLAYDVAFMQAGAPVPNSLALLRIPMVRTVTFPIAFAGSQAVATVAATSTATFNIQKNGSNIGTMVFAGGASTATFTLSSATSFAAGDILSVIAPASQDTTLGNVSGMLAGKY